MSDLNSKPTPDILDQATAALRDAAISDSPPAHLAAATVADLEARSSTITPARSPAQLRRKRMLRYIGYGSVTAVAVGLMAVVGIMWTAPPASAAELTAALEKIGKAKSFRHATTMTFDGKKMFEMVMYKQGDRMRFEASKTLAIVVDDKGNAVQFDHTNKTVTRLDSEKLLKDTPKPTAEVQGLIEKIRDLKGEGVERAGEETLDGKKTNVYVLKDVKLQGVSSDWKVWVDKKLNLLVRMEMTKGNAGAEAIVTTEFSGWDEEFDEKLFSFDVPAGYKLIEAKKEK